MNYTKDHLKNFSSDSDWNKVTVDSMIEFLITLIEDDKIPPEVATKDEVEKMERTELIKLLKDYNPSDVANFSAEFSYDHIYPDEVRYNKQDESVVASAKEIFKYIFENSRITPKIDEKEHRRLLGETYGKLEKDLSWFDISSVWLKEPKIALENLINVIRRRRENMNFSQESLFERLKEMKERLEFSTDTRSMFHSTKNTRRLNMSRKRNFSNPKNFANNGIDEGLNNKLVKDLRDKDGVVKSHVSYASPAGQFDKQRASKMIPLSDQAQSLMDFDVKGTYTYKFRLQRGDYVRISIDGGTRVYVGIIDQIVMSTIHTGPASFNGYAFVGFFADVKTKKCSYMEIVDDKSYINEPYVNVYVGKPNIQLVNLLNSVK